MARPAAQAPGPWSVNAFGSRRRGFFETLKEKVTPEAPGRGWTFQQTTVLYHVLQDRQLEAHGGRGSG